MTIYADRFTAVDLLRIPMGYTIDVVGTPFDFRTPKLIGRDIDVPDEQMGNIGGYGHNYWKKIFFADRVSLKLEELNNLVEQYGNEKTAKIIVALDLYKKSSGKVYASDYNAILNWVVAKVERDEKRELEGVSKKSSNRYKSYTQREYNDLENFYDIGGD